MVGLQLNARAEGRAEAVEACMEELLRIYEDISPENVFGRATLQLAVKRVIRRLGLRTTFKEALGRWRVRQAANEPNK
jgi:hypothetical protein